MSKKAMLINAGYPRYPMDEIGHMTDAIAGNVRFEYQSNGNVSAACEFDLSEFEVYVIGELSDNPWSQLALFSVISETLKRRHAARITLIVPRWNLTGRRGANYVDHTRCDSSRTITRILDGCGIDRIVTLTPSALLRSPLFPIEVEQPGFKELFRCMFPKERKGWPLIIAEDPGMYESARMFANEVTMEPAVNHYADHSAFISTDVRGRDVLIYTEALESRRILLLEDRVLRCGASSCAIFAPLICLSDTVMKDFFMKVHSNVYTFEKVLYGQDTDEKLKYLPVGHVIAEWIRKDIEKRDLTVG